MRLKKNYVLRLNGVRNFDKVKFLAYEKDITEVQEMNEELAYSIHLGSDKKKLLKQKRLQKVIHQERHHFQIMEYKMQLSYQK